MTATPKHTNRLANETSPYLLQHAHNPVNWYPWGEEALERARRDDRLILLSIGYSACHWCHVMERESFEDEAIAALMNEHYVNIKVDREERPDIDEVYMAATLALNQGQGGWPMTVFLTPSLEPVFAGTYFPPRDYYGRPGFRTILEAIAKAWQHNRAQLHEQASGLVAHLREHHGRTDAALDVGETELRAALQQFSVNFDSEHGGFGSAPKFPPATGLSLLLRLHERFADEHALDIVSRTLDAMACGGIYDQVGGGFARYSTDREWLVPHFEKMLYDNALLTSVYLEAYQATANSLYRRIATETLDYVINEMTATEGGFYSSTDADSEGEEGKFFVWTPDQIAAVLDDEAAHRFSAYYDITPIGNWEGKSIPRIRRPLHLVAKEIGVTPRALQESLETARAKVYMARKQRIPPGLDDKILTAWNGLMIRAFSDGYRVLFDPRYLEAAQNAAEFLRTTHVSDDGQLLRTSRSGKAHVSAYLEDYAYLSEGLISLYEAGGGVEHLYEALRLMEHTLEEFRESSEGALYHTGRSHETLIVRYREGTDGATPSANAVAASALARLSYHFDREDLRVAATEVVRAFGQSIAQHARVFAKSLIVVDFLLDGPIELAYVGAGDSERLRALRQEAAKVFVPRRVEGFGDPALPETMRDLPLLEGKALVNGDAALYVCRNFTCHAPVTDPAQVAMAVADVVVGTGRWANETPSGGAAE